MLRQVRREPHRAAKGRTEHRQIGDFSHTQERSKYLFSFHERKHRLHQIRLILNAWREARVVTHARNRIEEVRRAFTMKQNSHLPNLKYTPVCLSLVSVTTS